MGVLSGHGRAHICGSIEGFVAAVEDSPCTRRTPPRGQWLGVLALQSGAVRSGDATGLVLNDQLDRNFHRALPPPTQPVAIAVVVGQWRGAWDHRRAPRPEYRWPRPGSAPRPSPSAPVNPQVRTAHESDGSAPATQGTPPDQPNPHRVDSLWRLTLATHFSLEIRHRMPRARSPNWPLRTRNVYK